MAARPRIIHSDNVCRIGIWQNALLIDVARDVDLEHMQRMGKAHAEVLADYPQGMVTLAVVGAQVPIATSESRAESARFVKALGDSLRRTVLVLENQGVTAQLLLTVIRGINVIARNPKLVVLPTVSDAIANLAPMIEGLPQAQVQAEMSEAFAVFREGYATSSALRAYPS
ncbi:MAG TPA: hypothetical protein VJR89_40495 [Polyangiales bacterium]|nr:hypothetical protein [Polyangiales bacterium]